MKTLLTTILLLSSYSFAANDLPVAPKEVIKEYLTLCKQYAKEDEVEAAEMKAYLLECVNSELEDNGYQPIKKLDL
ncbi:MAG: hypothetical protein V2I33_14880 [Kangiellaceae bacterium]|jgi:hypothetical protein|nr:hypothetical protein [Kangiellaceae bacterium]